MSETRLSKLQKWILVNAYKKTILKDNSGLTILQHWTYRNTSKIISMDTSKVIIGEKDSHMERLNKLADKASHDLYWENLFRAEILSDYFKCKTDTNKFACSRLHHFEGKNNKAQVTLTRSLRNLVDKGLIEWMVGKYSYWQGIRLTEKGVEKALMLISSLNKSDVNIKLTEQKEV